MLNSNFSCLCSLALCTSSTTCLGSCCTGLPSQSWSIYLWQHSRVLISSIGGERGLTFALLFCFFFLVQCYDWLYWKQTIESKKWLSVISYFFRLPETARDCQTTLDWPLKLHWNMDYTAVYRVFLVTWYSEDTHTHKKKITAFLEYRLLQVLLNASLIQSSSNTGYPGQILALWRFSRPDWRKPHVTSSHHETSQVPFLRESSCSPLNDHCSCGVRACITVLSGNQESPEGKRTGKSNLSTIPVCVDLFVCLEDKVTQKKTQKGQGSIKWLIPTWHCTKVKIKWTYIKQNAWPTLIIG